MVLSIIDAYFPYSYTPHIIGSLFILSILRALAQGRKTNRERDLHGRTFIITGGFTPLGLTLLQHLSSRGAKIIALSPYPITSTRVTILIDLLRSTFKNEEIYAEECDVENVESVREFCMRFLTDDQIGKAEGKEEEKKEDSTTKKTIDKRIDGVVFLHEYSHIGSFINPSISLSISSLFNSKSQSQTQTQQKLDQQKRDSNSLSTFLLTTLLLPLLLTSPVERDIRIINVVNPFYAAASIETTFDPTFDISSSASSSSSNANATTTTTTTSPSSTSTSTSKSKTNSIFLKEAHRSLNTIILTRHLQRILDALPSSQPPPPKTSSTSSTNHLGPGVQVVNPRMQKSNIVAVSVVPGISRESVKRMVGLGLDDGGGDGSEGHDDSNKPRGRNWIGILIYIILLPLLHLTTKSQNSAIQSVLHVLFLPTPFKIISSDLVEDVSSSNSTPTSTPTSTSTSTTKINSNIKTEEEILKPGALYRECSIVKLDVQVPSRFKPTTTTTTTTNQEIEIKDDNEYGGELAGRLVWEAYEDALKVWESRGKK